MADRKASLRGRLIGRLVGFHNSDKGYAFLDTGPGTPEYFVGRDQVEPEDWFAGSLLEFTPGPPKPGTTNMRAARIIARNAEAEERAS